MKDTINIQTLSLTAVALITLMYVAVMMSQLHVSYSSQVLGLSNQDEMYSEFKPIRLHHGVPVINSPPSDAAVWHFGTPSATQQ